MPSVESHVSPAWRRARPDETITRAGCKCRATRRAKVAALALESDIEAPVAGIEVARMPFQQRGRVGECSLSRSLESLVDGPAGGIQGGEDRAVGGLSLEGGSSMDT